MYYRYYEILLYIGIFIILFDLIRKKYLQNFFYTIKDDLFQTKGILLFFIFIIILISILFLDFPLQTHFRRLKDPFMATILFWGNEFGNGHYMFPLLFLLYFFSLVFHFNKIKQIIGVILLGTLLSGLIGQILKILFLRMRPYVELNPLSFFCYSKIDSLNRLFSTSFHSFPSGHTLNAFGFITPIFLSLKKRWYRYLLFIIPGLTGLARIFYNNHWLSDVILGAALGIYITMIIYKNNIRGIKNGEERHQNPE